MGQNNKEIKENKKQGERVKKMNDKNGIEIIRENCKHKTPCNGCGLVERDCKVGDKHCQFTPSLNALEARITELQAQQFTRKEIGLISYILGYYGPPSATHPDHEAYTTAKAKCYAILSEEGKSDER